MIRIPNIFINKLLITPKNRNVQRLIVAHPKSVQYIQHDPVAAELCIRYTTGAETIIKDLDDPAYIKKAFDDLVYQIKDAADS
jgi:hypothetical protein